MFSHCELLASLPDISKWNTNNVEDITNMFDNCLLLLYIPNLQIAIFDDTISENFEFEEYEISNDVLKHKQGNK